MTSSYGKHIAILLIVTTAIAIVLSVIWRVPYIFTFAGVSALVLAGHLVTIDDDRPGGWSNPEGSEPFPWRELAIKVAVLLILGLAALVPAVRALGR